MTDEAIRHVQAAKGREEEQTTLKKIEANLRGLPPGFVLAACGRHLVRQGPITRLTLVGGGLGPTPGRFDLKPKSRTRSASVGSLYPTLADPRPLSQASDSSGRSRSTKSMRSAHSSTSRSFNVSESEDTGWMMPEPSCSELGSISSHMSTHARPPRSLPGPSSDGSSASSSPKKRSVSSAHLFLMNDLVVLAEPVKRLRKPAAYRLLEHFGISRVLSVTPLLTTQAKHSDGKLKICWSIEPTPKQDHVN